MQQPGLEPADLPADAIEVGRIADAWRVKGWFKIHAYSAAPEALFSSRRWYLQPASPSSSSALNAAPAASPPTQLLRVREAREHADTVVASAHGIDDRSAAEALRGARIFVPRSSFPSAGTDEYYWVDLLGLDVVNREGVALGQVRDLMSTGPQTVLVLAAPQPDGTTLERMIPFVSAYVDTVDLAARRITVDWQTDY